VNKKQKFIRALRRSKDAKGENNPQAFNKVLQQAGQHSCKICAPWDGENKVKRTCGKRGAKKPKNKHKFKS
jgi:hypothetical protein